MEATRFTEQDIRQIEYHGLTLEEAQRQLGLFSRPRPYLKLAGPCTVENGIQTIDPERMNTLTETYEQEGRQRRCVKFVPASGAASRMFKFLLRYYDPAREISSAEIAGEASAGDKDARQFLVFAEGIRRFAFFADLRSVMADHGLDMEALLKDDRFRDILRFLLTEDGLNYANLPKGLLKFHEYADRGRTPFDEHLVEAASYITDKDGRSLLHFTVSEEHLERFQRAFEEARQGCQAKYRVDFNVSFSLQDPSTDTLAVDLDNRPFRREDGALLFRPGGHGALLQNLQNTGGDIVFIKNIDNVAPDHLKTETFKWKKIMGGYLIDVQNRIFSLMERLAFGHGRPETLEEAANFLKQDLLTALPADLYDWPPEETKDYLMDRLNRPVRVCGMVENVGEPGGGPFWVEDETGLRSLQIVETAQIDMESEAQRRIFEASTHFNPVDLVCGIRDWQGNPFDLSRFVDSSAVFIARKSKDGKELKALEHPGLWNGSMSRWITLFVDVPGITFNPVKTVNDLLRKEHQPAEVLGIG